MDKNNVAYVVSNGQEGYPAGHFFSAALDIVVRGAELNDGEIYQNLETMVAHADSTHKQQLRESMPNLVSTIEKVFSGEYTPIQALDLLQPSFVAMYVLLPMALPELADGLKEYWEDQAKIR